MKHLRWLGFVLGLVLFLGVLRTTDLPGAWSQIRALRGKFGVILLFYGVIFGLDTLGWRWALPPEARRKTRWGQLFRIRLAGEAVNYVTPTAWIGGEPVKAYLLSKRYGVPVADGMASVVVAKTTFTLSMFCFILSGMGVALLSRSLNGSILKWVWFTLPALGVLLGLFVAVQFIGPFRRAAALAGRVAPAWASRLSAAIPSWDRSLIDLYRKSPRAILLSFGFHLLGWVAGIGEVYLILRFLNVPVTVVSAWSLEALWILLKTSAFLIPASLGASEGFRLLVCFGLGINLVSGLALALIRRARELIWMGLGLLEFSRQR